MYILGLTTLGDAAASLVCDGKLVAAAEEERFSRVKHHSGFRARVDRGVAQVSDSYLGMLKYPRMIRRRYGPSGFRFRYLEHHLCHAASAFLVSPFESAAIFTLDGTGEETTTLFSRGQGTRIQPLKRIKLPHSLGQFYSAVTNLLGFDMFGGDEWKVMGLAAYGEPEYYDFFSNRVLTTNGNYDFRVNIRTLDHHLAKRYQFSDEIICALGPPRRPDEPIGERHQNIASSAQKVLEDVVLHLLEGLHKQTGEESLCLAGGVAFNSVMNGRIINESPFKRVFIQPAAGDAGCSLGAAFLTHNMILKNRRVFEMDHAYWGPSFSNEECADALRESGLRFETAPDEELLPRVARLIADGAIVGWFQGRMEFGPRALGNRSFLADPRRADMRELLNKKVKLREWFRPLAPSMLEESSAVIFGVRRRDPFMVTVFTVAEGQRERIPAVVHVDNTARPQTVSRATNPRYWNLIKEFGRLTGVPALLNTSFNIQEPIVCSPRDAIRTFKGASFDALVLENNLALRAAQ